VVVVCVVGVLEFDAFAAAAAYACSTLSEVALVFCFFF